MLTFKPQFKQLLFSLCVLVSLNTFSQSPDFKIQHIQVDVPGSGLTLTSASPQFDGVANLNKSFIIISNNRRNGAGPDGDNNNTNVEARGLSCTVYFSDVNTITFSRGSGATVTTRVNIMVVEYIGPTGGVNEIIVRHRGSVSPTNGTTPQTLTMSSTPTNINKCIPFYSVQTTDTQNGAAADTFMSYCSGTNTLNYHRGGAANTVTARVEVVEFIGSNWSVGHGDSGTVTSGNTLSDSGTITLNTSATGTGGSTFNVGNWANAFIWHTYKGDSNSGSNEAIADNYPIYTIGSTSQVNWEFHANHDGASERHFVHVLVNSNMNVWRESSNTSNTQWESIVDITAAGLTDLQQSLILGSSYSSGGGTAYGRGWRNYYFKTLTEAAHWSHRSGNTMKHELQIIDLVGLTTVVSAPEINIQGLGNTILTGDTTPSTTDGTDLGNVYYNGGTITRSFTIENTGTLSLDVSSISSSNGLFTISGITTPTSIASTSSTTFNVTFTPTNISTQTATITINNTDSNENPYTFTVRGEGIDYCNSNGTTNYNTGVTLVSFNTINNADVTKNVGYEDFTAIATTVMQGSSYNLTVNVDTDGNYTIHAFVWIDWNQDGDFNDSGEAYDMGTAKNTSNGPTSASPYAVTVPPTATLGSTRMRVSSRYNTDPGSCNINFDGEVEDYTVNIISSTPMPEINITGNGVNIADGDATPDVADHTFFGSVDVALGSVARTFTIENLGTFNLTLDGASPYVVLSGHTSDFTLTANPSTPIAPSGSTTFTVTFNPTATGTRTVTVSIANNDDDEHPYTFVLEGVGFDFGSVCGVTINTFPYAEDFETGIGSWSQDAGDNFDWTRDLGGTPTNNTGPDIAASGSYYMYTEATGNTNNTANFISPCFDLTSTTNPRITFFYHMHGSTYTTNAQGDRSYTNYMGTLNVDLSTDGGVTFPTNLFSHTGYVQVDELSSWIPLSFDLSSYIGQTIKIRIQGIISNDSNSRSDMAIDYFVLTDKPEPLYAPGGITADLALWLKANDGHNYANGQSVSLWQDQGRGADARTHVTGQEPTYRDNVSQNVNFNPVIEFDNPYNSFTTDIDYRHDLTTNSQFLIGDYGMYTQEMFIVLIPDDTPINSSFGFMDVLTADSNLTKSETDATGIGFGDYTGRINNEVITYAHSTYNKNESGDGFAVYQQGSESYTNIGIINTRNNTLNNNQELYYNANDIREFTNDQAEYLNTSDTRYFIGRSEGWQASLNARVAEVITYSSRKNDTDLTQERNRIQSYLAIKYGITLGVNGTSQDYVASDGTLIWDVNTSTPTEDVFNYNITGIGRDDVAELNQKQSKSVNTTNDITIGHGDILATNNLNTNNFTADKSYLVWGNNNGSLTAQTPIVVNLSAGISGLTTNVEFTSIGRTWKVVKKGTVGMAKIAIPQTMLTATITPPGSFLMFISDEPTFSPTSEYRIMNLNGSNLETYYEFTSSKKFITFGYAPEKTFTRSIYFNGTTDYLDAGNKLNLNSSFTISAWVKRSNTNASIVSKRNSTYANGGYDFKINASGNLEMSWKNGATQTITSSVAIPSNKWHHVAVVYNGTQAKLYIDGVEDVTQTKNLAVPITNSESFLIAAADGNESNTTSFFQGNIDEVRIWNTALSQDQLRYVMNQEIENDGTKVSGSYFKNLTITPSKNDINAVDWASLKGYYPMSVYTFTNCKDASGNGNVAAIKKLNTVDWQTAPLPYVSIADTDWDVSSTWQNGSVQTIPGTASIVDATKTVDWNIVQISSNVTLENSSLPAANFGNRNVLGLLVDNTKKLEVIGVNPTTIDPYSGTGNGITISHYLGLNGKIDLQGESQLIQTLNSDLNVGTNGVLERDQQGVGNKYWYNDWSSPVYSLNDGLNYSRIIDVLRDGTNPSSPGAITYVGGYDGAVGPPITLSTYWMYKYANHPEGSYSLWEQIGNTGKIYPGQGFLMKGTGAAADQNYVFVGKPNNGNFDLNITNGYDYLLGNPYASAIDSWEFIDDNPDLRGELYFWEHYGGTNHNLKDYQAGYATLTKAGGVTATSGGVIPAGVSNLGTSTKIPGRFIPVGQGFFVVGENAGTGSIHFKNSQRIFFKEAEETGSNFGSVFMKGITKKTTKSTSRFMDNRQKIRIGFEGAKVDHRQLLLTIDENASDGVDRGYEAEIYEVFEDDMYWVIQDKKYVIQATNAIENNKEILLGVKVKETGTVKIKIDELENEDVNMQLFLKDSLLQKTYNLKENPFEQEIEAGEYVNRFYLVFKPIPKVIEEDTEIIEEVSGVHIFMNNQIAELQIQKDAETNISEIKLVNYLGQNIKIWNQKFDGTLISLPIKLATGVYVVQMKTEKGIINKKIIIE